MAHASAALHQQVGGTMSHNVEQNVKKKKKLLLEIKLLTFTFLLQRKRKMKNYLEVLLLHGDVFEIKTIGRLLTFCMICQNL